MLKEAIFDTTHDMKITGEGLGLTVLCMIQVYMNWTIQLTSQFKFDMRNLFELAWISLTECQFYQFTLQNLWL